MKSAFVTGSSISIGKAIADQLTIDGYNVTYHGTRPLNMPNYLQGDLTTDCERICSQISKLNVLVCCAGGNYGKKKERPVNDNALDISSEDFRLIIERNLFTTVNVCRYLVPKMEKGGKIVLIGSSRVGNHNENGGFCSYLLAKAAIHEYTLCLSAQLHKKGITVNCVAPGRVKNERGGGYTPPPDKPLGQPEQITPLVSFLCSDAANYITGQIIRADGGIK